MYELSGGTLGAIPYFLENTASIVGDVTLMAQACRKVLTAVAGSNTIPVTDATAINAVIERYYQRHQPKPRNRPNIEPTRIPSRPLRHGRHNSTGNSVRVHHSVGYVRRSRRRNVRAFQQAVELYSTTLDQYWFPLRRTVSNDLQLLSLQLPVDLAMSEGQRLAQFVQALPVAPSPSAGADEADTGIKNPVITNPPRTQQKPSQQSAKEVLAHYADHGKHLTDRQRRNVHSGYRKIFEVVPEAATADISSLKLNEVIQQFVQRTRDHLSESRQQLFIRWFRDAVTEVARNQGIPGKLATMWRYDADVRLPCATLARTKRPKPPQLIHLLTAAWWFRIPVPTRWQQ